MRLIRNTLIAGLAVTGIAAGLVVGAPASPAADHLEAPLVMLDGRTDINDLYVFESPNEPDNTVMIMTVNPLAGVASPTSFDDRAEYRFVIDNDGDGERDRTITATFGEVNRNGTQDFRVVGGGAVSSGTTGSNQRHGTGGWTVAGTYDDPFFFDLQAFNDQVKAAGGERTFCDGEEADFLAGTNVSAIVVEVRTEQLLGDAGTSIGVWAETWDEGRLDRLGRPAINTVLIDDGSEDAFNSRAPHRDLATFGDQVKANLLALSGLDGSGYTDAEAQGLVETLLPDILTYDTAEEADYLNGRGLEDDVIDVSLAVVTGGLGENGTPVLDSDCVDSNDVDFIDSYPYLAPAHDL